MAASIGSVASMTAHDRTWVFHARYPGAWSIRDERLHITYGAHELSTTRDQVHSIMDLPWSDGTNILTISHDHDDGRGFFAVDKLTPGGASGMAIRIRRWIGLAWLHAPPHSEVCPSCRDLDGIVIREAISTAFARKRYDGCLDPQRCRARVRTP